MISERGIRRQRGPHAEEVIATVRLAQATSGEVMSRLTRAKCRHDEATLPSEIFCWLRLLCN